MQLLPQSAIIAIAIGGSVLILAIIVMLVLWCVLCNRSRKRKIATNEQAGTGVLVNNQAYNVGNFNNRLVSNPAYNNLLTSNPAYNRCGDNEPYYSLIQN